MASCKGLHCLPHIKKYLETPVPSFFFGLFCFVFVLFFQLGVYFNFPQFFTKEIIFVASCLLFCALNLLLLVANIFLFKVEPSSGARQK